MFLYNTVNIKFITLFLKCLFLKTFRLYSRQKFDHLKQILNLTHLYSIKLLNQNQGVFYNSLIN